jgi:hypothetical protein
MMRKQHKRQAAITIEYLIITIVVLGIGACLLSFQGTIGNTVVTAQSSFESLQGSLLTSETSTTTTHLHSWSALIIKGDGETEENVYGWYSRLTFSYDYDPYFSSDSTTQHKCETCGELEPHKITSMTQEELVSKLKENQESAENVTLLSGKECSDCNYWEAIYQCDEEEYAEAEE